MENSSQSIHGQCPKKVSGVLFSNNWNKVFIFKLVEQFGECIEPYRIWSRWINWTMGNQQENTFKGSSRNNLVFICSLPMGHIFTVVVMIEVWKNMTNVVQKRKTVHWCNVSFTDVLLVGVVNFSYGNLSRFRMLCPVAEVVYPALCRVLRRKVDLVSLHHRAVGVVGTQSFVKHMGFFMFPGWFARMCPQLSLFHVGKL